MKLFSPDSKFMRAMSMLGDLLLLNLIFLICCVPIVTIGAASTALYTVAFRMARGTGLRGLTGIPKKRGMLVRPLLEISRERIEAYLVDCGVTREEIAKLRGLLGKE